MKKTWTLILRYALLVILGLGNLFLFYKIFTPLTVYPVYYILSLAFEPVFFLSKDPIPAIFFKGYVAQIISACVAGSAYYLLVILNLATPMNWKKRIFSLLYLLIGFLVINIVRIAVFAFLVPKGYQYFDITHQLTWYFGSTIMVVILWFTNILIFRIREIPAYSDIKYLYAQMVNKDDIRNS